MGKLITRMGDGSRVEMSEAEIQQDLEAGSMDGADRAAIASMKEAGEDAGKAARAAYAAAVERALAAPQPLPVLREAIMDATDQFVMAESLGGDWASVVEAGALRRFGKLRFGDQANEDWVTSMPRGRCGRLSYSSQGASGSTRVSVYTATKSCSETASALKNTSGQVELDGALSTSRVVRSRMSPLGDASG